VRRVCSADLGARGACDRTRYANGAVVEILELDPVTGRKTPLAALVRRALTALNEANIPYAVIGATALAVRGLHAGGRDRGSVRPSPSSIATA
jgi:hypothetical protein